MKIKLPKSAKSKIKAERNKVFEKMSAEDITQAEWDALNRKYQAYSEMMKPSWTITPDTLLVAATNLAGIVLILNFEKLDIVRSKAMSFVLKGRV
jgi:hypothetical protein